MSAENHISIRLFGVFRKFHNSPVVVPIAANTSVSAAKTALGHELKKLNPAFSDFELLEKSALADERRVLTPDEIVKAGSSLAILPPVCGG